MLVIDGSIHPAFIVNSTDRKPRDGVGVSSPTKVHFVISKGWVGFVTLSQTERNLPTIAIVDARDFSDLACWLIVQIGPVSLNVTTPCRQLELL